MNISDLKKFVQDNPKLVKLSPSEKYPNLFVLKYSKAVFYDDLWNEFLEECRGLVVDKDFNPVSIPFTKIYNYGIENCAPVLDDSVMVDAYNKINGFMVAVTWVDALDDILISTTGSLDSPYVKMAESLIDKMRYREVCQKWHGSTLLFECVHRDDPHIITEHEGMHLIGYREKSLNSRVHPDEALLRHLSHALNAHRVGHFRVSVGELKRMAKETGREGFVAYTDDGQSFKIKSPYYLTLKWLARNPRTDKIMTKQFREQIDEEYYPLLGYIRENIEHYTSLNEQQRLQYVRDFLEKQ